jgi:hypothetical protein
MRRALLCVFVFGLSACDSSGSDAPKTPLPHQAGEPGQQGKNPSRADATDKSAAQESGSSTTAAPAKSRPRKSDADKPDAGSPAPTCAGFAGFTCPGLGRCADDEADDCDPDRGGADCAGVCICDAKAKCRDGQTWNADLDACRCEDAEAEAQADAGVEAAADEPMSGCGGIAALECPGASTCEDNPDDDCDPMSGGADCGGVCRCNVAGVCMAPAVWNPSPSVCACES